MKLDESLRFILSAGEGNNLRHKDRLLCLPAFVALATLVSGWG
jgi:hypothetical protein